MNKLQEHSKPKQIQFNNNPFSLAFNEMSKAFKINQNPAVVIIVGAIVIAVANQIFGNVPSFLDSINENTKSNSLSTTISAFSSIFVLVFFIASIFVSTVWAGFVGLIGVSNAKDESVHVQASFRASLSKFWTILGINLMIGLVSVALLMPSAIIALVGVGLLSADLNVIAVLAFVFSGLLFIGGIVLAVRYSLARNLSLYAVFDESLSAFPAMKRSATLTKKRLIETWGMSFPGTIIPIVGPLLATCGLGAHYLQLKVYKDSSAELPKVHILSWLPVMLIVAGFLLVGFVGAVIALIAISNN